jgi:WD40 repeat protein
MGGLIAGEISGSGNRVAIADRSKLVTVLNSASGSRELSIVQEFPIRELALSENGDLLGIGDDKGQIHVWNVELGRRIAVRDLNLDRRFDNSLLTDMAFQPETQDLICTSLEGAFRMESVLPRALLERAEVHLSTNWSSALWQRYFKNAPFDPAFRTVLTEEEQLTEARIK